MEQNNEEEEDECLLDNLTKSNNAKDLLIKEED